MQDSDSLRLDETRDSSDDGRVAASVRLSAIDANVECVSRKQHGRIIADD